MGNGLYGNKSLQANKWLINNFNYYNNNYDLLKAFNKTFNTNFNISSIRHRCGNLRLLRLKTPFFNWKKDKKYDEWLLESFEIYDSTTQIAKAFNEYFNLNLRKEQIKGHCKELGFHKIRFYTNEQNEWLKNNIDLYSSGQLTMKFNKKFNTNKSISNILQHCIMSLNKHLTDNKSRWLKEVKERAFEKGMKKNPVGSERIEHNQVVIKNKEGKWIPKTRYINDINDSNQIVILLDKNKPITKENTIVADRHILGYMVGNKYFDLQPKLKHLAIKNCQLKEILDKEK